MNKLSWSLVLSLLLSSLFSRSSQGVGEVGNNNPTGVTGEYYGSIVTGGSYDPFTGNAKRFVDDLMVTGSIGAYPLKWTRVLNSRGGSGLFGDGSGWRHSYQWGLTIRPMPTPNPLPCAPPEPPAGTVSYPDGGVVMFHREVDNAGVETWLQADGREPMGDRIVHVGGPDYDLSLKDGGRVEFRIVNGERVATKIVDPHGQTTQLEYDLPRRLWKVTEPGGRYLLIHYLTYEPEENYPAAVEVIDKVEVYDGPQAHLIEKVQYAYERENASGMLYVRFYYLQHASYDDGSQATYHNLRASRVQPNEPWSFAAGKVETCKDVRFAGAMRNIKYKYVDPTVSLTHPVAWGQIESERNLTTNVEVSKVRYPTDADCPPSNNGNLPCFQRTETRADGAKRVIQYGSVASPHTESYTDFAYPGGPHHATTTSYIDPIPGTTDRYLKIVTNARGYHASTEKEYNVGAVMAVIHHNGSRIKYTYSDPNNPHHIASQEDENGHITHFDRYGAPGFPPDPSNPNRIWRIRYPDGGEELFTYNNFGQVLWHRMTSGGDETFTYDTRGLKETHTPPATPSDNNPGAHPTRYFYYTSGPHMDRLRYVQDPRGNTTEYQYNLRGLVTKVIHPDTKFIESEYDQDGTLRWTEDELRHKTSYTYDEYKRVIEAKNHLNESITTSYAAAGGNPLWHTTPSVYKTASHMQKVTEFDYDANFRRKWMVVAPGTDDAATTRYTYDEAGNLKTVEDPRSKFTTYEYDDRNRRVSVTNNELNETTTVLFDGAGNKRRETRPDGAFRTWDYDSMNRLWHACDWRTNEEPAAHQTTTYLSDHSGNVLSITDTKGAVYGFLYDKLNRKESGTFPPDAATGQSQSATWLYDIAGNLTLHKNPAGQYQHFEYDNRNRQWRSYWNLFAQPNTATNWSIGQEITTTLDAASRVTEIQTNGGQTIVAFGYDAANRKLWEDQTLVGQPTRRVKTDLDQDGKRINLQIIEPPMEGGGMIISPEMSGSGSYSLTYGYTERNQLKQIAGAAGEDWSFTYFYDPSGNMTSRRADYNNKTSWTNCPNDDYDALNRPRSWEQTGSNGFHKLSHYQYDRANREEATWRSEDNHRGESFEYEITNQLKKVSYNVNISPTPAPPSPTPPNPTPTPPNATPTPGATPPPGQVEPVIMVDEGYPGIVSVTMTTATADATIFYRVGSVQYLTPTHNSSGQGTNGTSIYTGPIHVGVNQVRYISALGYKAGMIDSAISELTVDNTTGGGEAPSAQRVVTYTHTPDKLNRGSMNDGGVVTNYAANALNQYTSTAGNSFAYDNNFNLTHGAGFNGVYDAANRLVSASNGGSGEAQTTIAGFVYDGLGRCVKRTVNGVATVFIYDGWKPIGEWEETTPEYFHAWNVYGPGADEILLRQQGDIGYIRFQLDRHGNVAFLLDNDANLLEKYTYDVFGHPKITDSTGTAVRAFSYYHHAFHFQGREYIRQLGVYDYRNRFYHPKLGRFIQTDPIGLQTEGAKLSAQQKALYVGGGAPEAFGSSELNLYRYCNNDPVNNSDPLGTYAQGKGWTNDTWSKFKAAQETAAAILERASKVIDPERFERVYGPGTATPKNMDQVSLTMQKMVAALRDDGTKGYVANAYADSKSRVGGFAPIGGKEVSINTAHRALWGSLSMRAWTAGHEAGHNVGLVHSRDNPAQKYANGNANEAFKTLPPAQRLQNPDHFMDFAWGSP